jgi:hypothetical protein
MPEPSHQDIFDNEGHINYDKVVEIVHFNLKNFLNAILEESFNAASDNSFRMQIAETNSKVRDQALDAFLERKHIVTSEFYVELETRFYTSNSIIMRAQDIDQSGIHGMETDLIELALAIEQLIDRSTERHSYLIEQLTLQLEELSFLAHQEFNVYCLQPQDFYKLFQKCIAPLNISADGKILISKLLYQNISPNLNDFYLSMQQFLFDVVLLPTETSKQHIDSNESYDSAIDNDDSNLSMSMTTGQFFAPVEQEAWNQEYEAQNDYVEKQLASTPEIIDEVAMDVYGPGKTGLDETTVSLLLQPYRPGTQSDSSPAQRRQFIRALSSVQRVEAASNAIFQAKQIKIAARRTLQEKGALDAIEIVGNEEKVIDFVSNIFQIILEDDSICDPVKSILAKLQISTIKLALIDFTFFQNAKHPARQLLNNITSIGTNTSNNEELLFKKLSTIVRNISESFDTDVQVFEFALSELQKLDFTSLQQQASKDEAELNKHKLRSQRSAAKRVVIHTIKKFTKNKEIPNPMLEFCLKCWAPHMAYVYMNHGRTTRDWRNSVRMLRRVIEVSQGIHSLQEVEQYIHKPDVFFENIRMDLAYFTNHNDEFEDVLEEAGVWYLTYLRKIKQDANEIESDPLTQEPQAEVVEEERDNVIHLFKNLSPASKDENIVDSIESQITKTSNEATETKNIELEHIISGNEDASIEKQNKISSYDNEQGIEENEAETLDEHQEFSQNQKFTSELASDTKFDESETDAEYEKESESVPEPELNVSEHLPESIVPGVWLEIYQGEDRAKRRLKFSSADIETNQLLFSDRSGDYKFEIDLQTFMDDLSTGRSSLISESNRFDLALSSVISNIRSSQDNSN